METFYERVQQLCEKRGIKITNLVKELGLSTSMPTNWKNGVMPSIDNLILIAKYFGVSSDYLLGISEDKSCQKNFVGSDNNINFAENGNAIQSINQTNEYDPLSKMLHNYFDALSDKDKYKVIEYARIVSDIIMSSAKKQKRVEDFKQSFSTIIAGHKALWYFAYLLRELPDSIFLDIFNEMLENRQYNNHPIKEYCSVEAMRAIDELFN